MWNKDEGEDKDKGKEPKRDPWEPTEYDWEHVEGGGG